MSFLAPLFLLGGLAIALPVIFHLIRRTTRERTPFSSLLFLQPSPPRLTRRSRLEHILLLVLRCVVLCLLAIGFARPLLKRAVSAEPNSGGRRIVVLVDSSASMRRANLWSEARAKVESLLRQTSPADQVALFTFDRQLKPLVTFEQWNAAPAGDRAALVIGKLSETSPGWSATHLGNALISAAEALADAASEPARGPRKIVLISDLQEGSRLDPLQGYEWPRGIGVSVELLKAQHPSNAGLQLVTNAEESEPKEGNSVRVRISNAGESKREQFTVGWAQPDNQVVGKAVEAYVPPGQSRIVALPAALAGSAADRILLRGDEEDFDNTVFVIPPEQTRLSVVYYGSDSETNTRGSLFFLRRAFQETRYQAVQVQVRPPNQPVSPGEMTALFVVTSPVAEEVARLLREQVTAGKTLLFALQSEEAISTLGSILGVDHLVADPARINSYALLAEIDFRHPLFASFADPRFSDFTKIHFWKYRRLNAATIPGARTLAKFDSGDPALLEVPVGKGRVVILTSGWGPDDSQLALSTKFIPLLYSLLELSGEARTLPSEYHVGDIVPLETLAGAERGALTIRAPAGFQLNVAPGETNFSQTMVPGIYNVASRQGPKRFAVNLDGAESRTTPLALDELERLGVPMARQVPSAAHEVARKALLQNAELENRQKLWRMLLLAALGMLLFETWLAGRTTRGFNSQLDAVP